MSDIDVLYNNKRKYNNLLSNVIYTKDNLKRAIDKLDIADDKVIKGYSINETRGDDGYLENKKMDIINMYNYLINTIIPAINKKINQISKDIDVAEAMEEAGD